jgi:ABC-type glutathione transport system ATPase component
MTSYDTLPGIAGISPEVVAKSIEMGSSWDAEAGMSKKSQKIQASSNSFNANKTPHNVVWKHIDFVAGEKKKILDDCWGNVPAGKVCAIMGPSGAGKSSLLNVLAGRSASAAHVKVTGNVHVAGHKINPVKFRERIAYVMQDDSLLATATPREALVFSAQMRLPNSTPDEEINNLVDDLLVDLGLDVCADTLGWVGGGWLVYCVCCVCCVCCKCGVWCVVCGVFCAALSLCDVSTCSMRYPAFCTLYPESFNSRPVSSHPIPS